MGAELLGLGTLVGSPFHSSSEGFCVTLFKSAVLGARLQCGDKSNVPFQKGEACSRLYKAPLQTDLFLYAFPMLQGPYFS